MTEPFDTYCETIWYTLKEHMLDHIVESLDRFRSLDLLDCFVFDRFKVHITGAASSIPLLQGRALEETMRYMDSTGLEMREGIFASYNKTWPCRVGVQDQICRTRSFLLRDGPQTTLQCKKNMRKEEVLESDRRLAMGLMNVLGKHRKEHLWEF